MCTVYWHLFSHHFEFFVLFWPQHKNYKTFYIGYLYVTVICLKQFFCDFFAMYSQLWRAPKVGTKLTPKTIFHTCEKPPEICSTMCTLGWRWTKDVGIRYDTVSISMAHRIAVFIKHSCTVEYRTLFQAAFVCGCVPWNDCQMESSTLQNFQQIQFWSEPPHIRW